MIVHEVHQNSEEWRRLRLGLPTASGFDRILTKTGKPSSQADAYIGALLAEWLMQAPISTYQSEWMERGHELEEEAWRYYEMRYDVDVKRGGFVTDDSGSYGASPDGRIYDGDRLVGGIELKCPSPEVHMGYLLGTKTVADAYRHQVQGTLWITGADWWDVMSYHPLLPPSVVRVYPDEDYIEALAEQVARLITNLEIERAKLLEQGYKPREVAS